MTLLPICTPLPASRETIYSYLARVSATWKTDAPDLAHDMGLSFKRLLSQEDEAFAGFAEWAKLTPYTMGEMLSWTGVKKGNVRTEFRGEMFGSRALRNPVMRGCPVCLREDAIDGENSPSSRMVMRGDWQLREVVLCVRHCHPLVPLWKATAPKDRFDIGARLLEIEAAILSGALDRPRQSPSQYDLWLDQRLEDGSDQTWLKDHSIFAVTILCRLLGQTISKQEIPSIPGGFHAVGFDLAGKGELAIRSALNQIAALATGAVDTPRKAFTPLYSQLDGNYLKEPDFMYFRDILRECLLDNWPFAAGDMLLGEEVSERRWHSLLTAETQTGIGASVLEQFLLEAGALKPGDPRPPPRRLFDANRYANLLSEIPTLVGPIAMRNAMGATRQELKALTEEGILTPRTRVAKIKNPWRIADGLDLVATLSKGAIPLEDEDKDWETLLLARRRAEITFTELLSAIRDKRLTVGRLPGEEGFHGIVVAKAEVDLIAANRQASRDAALNEEPGAMAAAEFGRSLGLRDGGVFLAMIEAGHVSSQSIVSPRTGRPQHRMTPQDVAAFHRTFVTLTSLSLETGLHRNSLRAIFVSSGITPFSPDGHDFGAVYLRSDLTELISAGGLLAK